MIENFFEQNFKIGLSAEMARTLMRTMAAPDREITFGGSFITNTKKRPVFVEK